jgi:hypothetical protein
MAPAALIDRLPGAKGPHPNRVPAEIEAAVLAHALDHPSHGALSMPGEFSPPGHVWMPPFVQGFSSSSLNV